MRERRAFFEPLGGGYSLSELRAEDTKSLVRHLQNRSIHEMTLRIPYPYAWSDAEAFLEFTRKSAGDLKHPAHFAIRDWRGMLIGVCGLDEVTPGQSAEIGYWLAESHWGRGIATSAVLATCQISSRVWHLRSLVAEVFVGNQASRRVLEKAGFQRLETLPAAVDKDGRMIDVWRYQRLLNERMS